VKNLAFVTGDQPGAVPARWRHPAESSGAIVIDTCGGGDRKAESLREGMETA